LKAPLVVAFCSAGTRVRMVDQHQVYILQTQSLCKRSEQ
jgi:hypothetical protein